MLLDAAYHEIARVDGIAGTHWRTRGAVAQALGAGGVFHWFVADGSPGSARCSALETVEIR
ncbi:MAG TPA: hypothetical protein VFZ65_00155 [Planctomycetota bacterium]|nr:hypothetical protein [Planctomycetota bacterium]